METKICQKCKTEKPIDDFVDLIGTPNSSGKYCKSCHERIQNNKVSKRYEKEMMKLKDIENSINKSVGMGLYRSIKKSTDNFEKFIQESNNISMFMKETFRHSDFYENLIDIQRVIKTTSSIPLIVEKNIQDYIKYYNFNQNMIQSSKIIEFFFNEYLNFGRDTLNNFKKSEFYEILIKLYKNHKKKYESYIENGIEDNLKFTDEVDIELSRNGVLIDDSDSQFVDESVNLFLSIIVNQSQPEKHENYFSEFSEKSKKLLIYFIFYCIFPLFTLFIYDYCKRNNINPIDLTIIYIQGRIDDKQTNKTTDLLKYFKNDELIKEIDSDEFQTIRITNGNKVKILKKPKKKTKIIQTINEKKLFQVIDTKHKWLKIRLIDKENNKPIYGWVLKKYTSRLKN